MQVTNSVIKKVAENARLELTEKEIESFTKDFNEILQAFHQLDEVDVSGVEPSLQPIDVKNVMREDAPGECLSQEDALSNSEHKKDGYFKGPKVV